MDGRDKKRTHPCVYELTFLYVVCQCNMLQIYKISDEFYGLVIHYMQNSVRRVRTLLFVSVAAAAAGMFAAAVFAALMIAVVVMVAVNGGVVVQTVFEKRFHGFVRITLYTA